MSQSLDDLPKDAPRGGDRFPWLRLRFQANGVPEDLFQTLNDTEFNVILIGQPAPSEGILNLRDLLRVLVIPDDPVNDVELARVHIPRPAFYLLRPDGHVAVCGRLLDPAVVNHYIHERLHFGE